MTDPISSLNPGTALPGSAAGQAGASAAQRPGEAGAKETQQIEAQQAGTPELQAIAATLNQRAQDLQTDLRFQVDKLTGEMVISVIDTQNNQVLLQVPGPEALAIAQSLQRLKMQLMDQKA
jgi:flagellar protein FlaG